MIKLQDFLEIFSGTEPVKIETIRSSLYLNPEEIEDILKFAIQENMLFEPIERQFQLVKEVSLFSEAELETLETFLENFSPRYERADVLEYHYNKNTQQEEIVGVDINKVADFLIKKFIFKTIHGNKIAETFCYNQGLYERVGDGFIKVESERLIGNKCSNYLVSEIVGKIQRKTSVSRKDFFENTPEHLSPHINGVVNLRTGELLRYKPDYNFRYKLPVAFIKGQDCPTFKKFLGETLYPEDMDLIQEWFGFTLYRRYFLKKGMILIGGKNTGKTTLINILISFIGRENISGISLQRITASDKFALASLFEKLLNVYDDLSFSDLKNAGGFKVATGNGYITAEYKFGDSFQFMPYAKQFFSANKIPPMNDLDDEANWFRWLPVQLDNEVPEEEQDGFLINKLTSPEEMSGILNWALEGLKRLFKNNRFSFNKTPDEVKAIMCRSGNPLYAFVSDVLQEKLTARISKEKMYEIYRVYAKENKLTPLSKEQLGRQLGKVAHFIVAKSDVAGRFWENVSIVSNFKDNPEIKKILDTLDTSLKTIRDGRDVSIDMFSKKVSNPSLDGEEGSSNE